MDGMQIEDPWQVLGLSMEADDGEIRRRYLELVKKHTPERDPEGFQRVNLAYEQLKDRYQRWTARLLDRPGKSMLEAAEREVEQRLRKAGFPADVLSKAAGLP